MKKRNRWLIYLFGCLSLMISIGLATHLTKEKAKNYYTVGVLQLVQHPSLDAAYQGFKDRLETTQQLDKPVHIVFQNGQGNQDNLKNMSEKLIRDKPNLLLGIGTPSAISLLNETKQLPILVTAVTDLTSLHLIHSNQHPGGNLTGTSDMVPITDQITLLLKLLQGKKHVGILYNAGEENSVIQVNLAKQFLEKQHCQVSLLTATSTNDVQQVTESLAKKVDGLYIPTDNIFASAMPIVGQVAQKYQLPVVTGSIDMAKEGGTATYGIDYYSLGQQTADMAINLLKQKKQPATYPVETSNHLTLYLNHDKLNQLNIPLESIQVN